VIESYQEDVRRLGDSEALVSFLFQYSVDAYFACVTVGANATAIWFTAYWVTFPRTWQNLHWNGKIRAWTVVAVVIVKQSFLLHLLQYT